MKKSVLVLFCMPNISIFKILFSCVDPLLLCSHPVNYVLHQAVSIRLHVKVALLTSIGGIAKVIGYK